MCVSYKETSKKYEKRSVRSILRGFFAHKKAGNKKGFTLVELLVGVTVLAILLPALYKLFIFSSQLNKEANLQGRADSLAKATMEEIKAVKYDDLKKWFTANGWTDVTSNDPDKATYIYEAEKEIDDKLKKLSFKLKKYEGGNYDAGVPKLPGSEAGEISIGDTQLFGNKQNDLAKEEMKSRLNVNTDIKQQIWDSIKNEIISSNTLHVYDSSRMTLTIGNVDDTKIKKKAEITVSYDQAHTTITVTYEVKFAYELESCGYKYLYYDQNGKLKVKSDDTFTFPSAVEFEETFSSGTVEKAYKQPDSTESTPDMIIQTMYIAYTPLNANDEITIISPAENNLHIIFEENKITGETGYVLTRDSINKNNNKNNFDDIAEGPSLKILINVSTTAYAFFSSNNPNFNALIDKQSVYQSKVETWLYEATVTAEVKGGVNDTTPAKATFTSTMFG